MQKLQSCRDFQDCKQKKKKKLQEAKEEFFFLKTSAGSRSTL